jgi:hypothetical protein
MPKVLTKLRVDEVSCVDRGAGENCKVVLWKRHDPERRKAFGYAMPKPEPRNVFHEIFSRKRASSDDRRDRIRHLHRHIADGSGAQPEEIDTDTDATTDGNMAARISHLADLITEASDGGVSRSEALAWILTNRHGRAAATHLTKREEPKMDRMTKNVIAMGEHEYTRILQKHASDNRLPNETAVQAFSRIFTEDTDEGRAIRKFWQISKQGSAAVDEDERDDDEDDERDAMEELEELAREERRRTHGMSKAQAFAKIYTDPANAKLAQRERRQNRPR